MKSWIRRVVAFLAVVLLSLSIVPNTVYAQEPVTPDTVITKEEGITVGTRNLIIRTCSTSLSFNGSNAVCTGTVNAYASKASSVHIALTLQKKVSGSWNTVNSWSTTVYSSSGYLSKTQSVGSGTYRVKGVYTSGGETVTVYSATNTK